MSCDSLLGLEKIPHDLVVDIQDPNHAPCPINGHRIIFCSQSSFFEEACLPVWNAHSSGSPQIVKIGGDCDEVKAMIEFMLKGFYSTPWYVDSELRPDLSMLQFHVDMIVLSHQYGVKGMASYAKDIFTKEVHDMWSEAADFIEDFVDLLEYVYRMVDEATFTGHADEYPQNTIKDGIIRAMPREWIKELLNMGLMPDLMNEHEEIVTDLIGTLL